MAFAHAGSCSFSNGTEVSTNESATRSSNRGLDEFGRQLSGELGGTVTPQIIGGETSSKFGRTFVVALLLGDGQQRRTAYQQQFCGGSLIRADWVLTAAHCVYAGPGLVLEPSRVTIAVHRHNLKKDIADEHRCSKHIVVEDIFLHPSWESPETREYDVALLKLAESAPCAPSGGTDVISLDTEVPEAWNGREAWTAGWGTTNLIDETNNFYDFPGKLQEVEVDIMAQNKCQNLFSDTTSSITESMVCARRRNHDSCFGDSGGPLWIEDSGALVLVGVVSWGISCAEFKFPGVYARVSFFDSWITSILPQPTDPCSVIEPAKCASWGNKKKKCDASKKKKRCPVTCGEIDRCVSAAASPTFCSKKSKQKMCPFSCGICTR